MVLGLRSRKFSVPGLSANPYSTISGWEMGTCRRRSGKEEAKEGIRIWQVEGEEEGE